MNPARVSALVSEKTKVILPVHIYGQPALMEEILSLARQHHLKVIEDCAQAHGAEILGQKVGTFGDQTDSSFQWIIKIDFALRIPHLLSVRIKLR